MPDFKISFAKARGVNDPIAWQVLFSIRDGTSGREWHRRFGHISIAGVGAAHQCLAVDDIFDW